MPEFDPKKLGEEADQMIAELNQNQSEEAKGETPEAEAVIEDPALGIEEAIVESGETPDDQGVDSEPSLEPDAEPVDYGVQIAEIRKELEKADQRHRVAQGMIAKKDEELTAMRQLITRMAEKAPAQEAGKTEQPAVALDTKSFVDEFGGDMVDMVQRIAADAAQSAYDKVSATIDDRMKRMEGSMQGVEQRSAETAQSGFEVGLDRLVPEWKVLNNDEGFNSWLQQRDEFAGIPRLDLLGSAVQAGDVNRAAVFFTAYQKSVAPEKPTLHEVTPNAGKSAKERLVAPGKSKAAAPAQEQKRIWNAAAVDTLYDGLRKGEITKQEFDVLERDMFAAQSDGRWAA